MTYDASDSERRIGSETGEETNVDPTVLDPDAKSPDRKELEKATRRFEAGDYIGVRESVRELVNSSDPQIVQAARDLKRRVDVDPVQIAVIVFCSAVFLVIAITYVLR